MCWVALFFCLVSCFKKGYCLSKGSSGIYGTGCAPDIDVTFPKLTWTPPLYNLHPVPYMPLYPKTCWLDRKIAPTQHIYTFNWRDLNILPTSSRGGQRRYDRRGAAKLQQKHTTWAGRGRIIIAQSKANCLSCTVLMLSVWNAECAGN